MTTPAWFAVIASALLFSLLVEIQEARGSTDLNRSAAIIFLAILWAAAALLSLATQ